MPGRKDKVPKSGIQIKINRALAVTILREEALLAKTNELDVKWVKKIQKFSQICSEGVSKTHIAFLGTTFLAKATNIDVDLYAIKPAHSKSKTNSYSARTLCHGVLVPLAAELGFDIGVTGREPLNNQPYFRMTRLNDGTPVHSGGRAAFDNMLELVREVSLVKNVKLARNILRAFIFVRRQFQKKYTHDDTTFSIDPKELHNLINMLVNGNSEGGRLAQAAVAGLIDVFANEQRVDCGRINDPSRKYPGDVCIRSRTKPESIEKAFEVRDKPVTLSDVQVFGKKCIDMGVREAAVVMVSGQQNRLDSTTLASWAKDLGLNMTLFQGWKGLVTQVLFWSEEPQAEAAMAAAKRIEARLIETEATSDSVTKWQSLIRRNNQTTPK